MEYMFSTTEQLDKEAKNFNKIVKRDDYNNIKETNHLIIGIN